MSRRADDPRFERPGTTADQPSREGHREEAPAGRFEEPNGGETRGRAGTEARGRGTADRPGVRVGAEGNGVGIAALVVGLLSVTLAFLIYPAAAGVLLGIAAIILGAMGISRANRLDGLHKGLSVTGLITGILGLLVGAAIIIGGAALIDRFGDQIRLEQLQEQVQEQNGG